MSPGRAPVSPTAIKPGMGYHLPFQWQPPSPRSADYPLGLMRDSPDYTSPRHTPSPLVFATPADEHGQGPTTTVSVTPDLERMQQRIFDAAPWLRDEKALVRHEDARARRARRRDAHETTRDDGDDAASGSLRWVRHSHEEYASTIKSELEFARTPRRDEFLEGAPQRPSPINGVYAQSYSSLRHCSVQL